jgi:hypothetical protein
MMLFATHGLVAPLLLLGYIACRLNRDNWRPAAAFFAFSLTQYFVFWNLSVPDLILFWLLGQPQQLSAARHTVPVASTVTTEPATRA